MAVRKSKPAPGEKVWPVPPETIIDVVSQKDGRIKITPMRYDQAIALKAKNGWLNQIFQKGFHSFKATE